MTHIQLWRYYVYGYPKRQSCWTSFSEKLFVNVASLLGILQSKVLKQFLFLQIYLSDEIFVHYRRYIGPVLSEEVKLI